MVPEVLLALLGVPGEVIVLVPATATAPERFAVNPDLHILEPPERASLDRLVAIGYAFRELESFVQRENEAGALAAVGAETLGPRRGNDGSLYRRALASGVADVLTHYESAILKLEQDILRGIVPALPAALESTLCEFALVLPSLWAVIQPVADANTLKGAALLHHLRAASLAAGAPALENALRTLEARARRAAHQQLLAWTVHGRLVDPHGEFWVRPVVGAGGDGGVFLGEAASAARRSKRGPAFPTRTTTRTTTTTTTRATRFRLRGVGATAASASGTEGSRCVSRLCRLGWSFQPQRMRCSRAARFAFCQTRAAPSSGAFAFPVFWTTKKSLLTTKSLRANAKSLLY